MTGRTNQRKRWPSRILALVLCLTSIVLSPSFEDALHELAHAIDGKTCHSNLLPPSSSGRGTLTETAAPFCWMRGILHSSLRALDSVTPSNESLIAAPLVVVEIDGSRNHEPSTSLATNWRSPRGPPRA